MPHGISVAAPSPSVSLTQIKSRRAGRCKLKADPAAATPPNNKETTMKRTTLAIVALALSGAAFGDDMHRMDKMQPGGMSGPGMPGMEKKDPAMGGMKGMERQRGGMQMNAPAGELADGEVRNVDRDAGKITLRHGPVASMGMPAMTMVYAVKDPAALQHLGVGDKVKFAAEKSDAGYTVTRIERAN
jgi:Cu(I)/Ag(I) efflux system protein CusF